MVSQVTIQSKVDRGFHKAAVAAGVPCQQYRPSGPNNPLDSANLLGTVQVLFDTNSALHQFAPRQRQKPEEWYGAFDATGVQVGDYLLTPPSVPLGGKTETLFVTAIDPFRPARLVMTNHVVEIHAPGLMAAMGLNQGYGGDIRTKETLVATGWPACIIKGPRGETGDAKLPGDTKLPWEEMLLPAMPGVTLRNDMIVLYPGENGLVRLIISLVELTTLGYRCMALYETT